MRTAAILTALMLLTACSGGTAHREGRLAKQKYLSAIEAVPAPMRNGSSGAPVVGLVVSGTITNDGRTPLLCSGNSFLLVRSGGDDVAASSQFCAVPNLAPQQSTYFSATFVAAPRDDLQLRFDHSDGSYEIHPLAVPPG